MAFDLYMVSYAVPGGMEAYEFGLTVPAGAIVQARLLSPGATDFGAGDDNFIVGTGGICQGTTDWFTMVKYQGIIFLCTIHGDPGPKCAVVPAAQRSFGALKARFD